MGINAIDTYSPISPESIVVAAGGDGCLKAWSISTRNYTTSLKWATTVSESRLHCLHIYIPLNYSDTIDTESCHKDFSVHEPMVICAGRDRIIHIVHLLTGRLFDRQFVGHEGTVTCLRVSTKVDIPFIVSGSEEKEVKVWSLATGNCLFDLKGHEFDVNAVAIHSPTSTANESVVISGGIDSTIRLWSYGTTKEMVTLTNVNAPVNAIVVVDFPFKEPMVVAGSADATIKIWSLLAPYQLLHSFSAHMDEVTCLAAYKGEGCFNSLVSGSIDNCVKVWDLDSFKFVKALEGHVHDVSGVCMFSTDNTDPSIASSSADIKIWYDFKNESIRDDYVDECFQFDKIKMNGMMHDDQFWPRISALAKLHTPDFFFNRYCKLFRLAVSESRPDFLALFLLQAPSAVVKCIVVHGTLKLAIKLGQQDSVKSIITCLVAHIQMGDCPDISPSRFPLDAEDVHLLAEYFPEEFERLIVGMRLLVHTENMPQYQSFLRANSTADGFEMDYIRDSQSNENALVSYSYLPLPIASHIQLLKAISDVCDKTNHTTLFNSQAGLMILGYAWAKFGMSTHIKLMVASYTYLVLATYNIYCFETMAIESYATARALLSIQLCFELILTALVLSSMNRNWYGYVQSIWHYLKLVIIAGGLLGNILRLHHMKDVRATRIILSITSIAIWFDALYYLRAFEGRPCKFLYYVSAL